MEDVMMALMQKQQFSSDSTLKLLLKFIDLFRTTTDSLIHSKADTHEIDARLVALRGEVFGEKQNVLDLEPSKLYASLINHSLDSLSIDFTFTQDGLQALENLLMNKYDLLITSLESPRLNGDALVAALRLVHNFNKGIKVVLITSRTKDKIVNKDDFDSIVDRKAVKDGGLKSIVKKMMNEKQ